MSHISEINSIIINKIDKDDEFYQALWGKEDFTPNGEITEPNDFNCGGFANGLEYIDNYVKELTDQDLDSLVAPYLDMVVYFFTAIKRLPGESDENLLSRMRALIVRECDWRSERFGTPWDILNVFCYYLDRELLYYIPNGVVSNIMINGDLETAIAGEWVFSPSGNRSLEDAFTGLYKLDFTNFTSVQQTVSLSPGTYILNSFVKPLTGVPEDFASIYDIAETELDNGSYIDQDFMYSGGGGGNTSGVVDVFNLSVQRSSDSFFYNTATDTWQSAPVQNIFSIGGKDYALSEFHVVVDGSYDVTIKYEKIIDFYLDHIELGLKEYSCFEILYIDKGLPNDSDASMWGIGTALENASYLDQSYMFATATSGYSDTYYQEILNTLAMAGVKGIFKREG